MSLGSDHIRKMDASSRWPAVAENLSFINVGTIIYFSDISAYKHNLKSNRC
jgi:hypothetical protein